MEQQEIEKIKKAGSIIASVREQAKSFIKPGIPLLEIAERIESQIEKQGAKPAFPVSLAIDEIAAHSTPSHDDTTKASGLLKVDLGCHIDGFIADTAFTIDLDNSEENTSLISTAESALKSSLETIKLNSTLSQIGSSIEKAITSKDFVPIANLSGHSIDQYELHSGITIPNFDNSSNQEIPEGLYAVEPFVTNGSGKVKDGKPSGIYRLEKQGNVRDPKAREVLKFIQEEYQTLPFCSRWIHKKFSSRGLLALRQIEQAGLLHHYPQLVEISKGKVAQAEHSVLLTEKEKTITTN
ncbi:type II methionyl aminopeptidase [Candidatus Pacearchaeota archaeon]|nr:type II methionyl aminopeptidase [Candidatus Pacearchaeota archaeon]|tara:strand:- start:114 stop:1001 length:888 start_codon:yes stop_codon:yes gene_type:complete